MKNKIELYFGSEVEGAKEVLNKLGAEQKILELFETKRIKKVEIIYENEPVHCKCTSSYK